MEAVEDLAAKGWRTKSFKVKMLIHFIVLRFTPHKSDLAFMLLASCYKVKKYHPLVLFFRIPHEGAAAGNFQDRNFEDDRPMLGKMLSRYNLDFRKLPININKHLCIS